MNDFFPEGYELPKSSSSYMKLDDGDNKFRILSNPVVGWLDWETTSDGARKPLRFKMDKKPTTPIDPAKPIKHFWSFAVYNYGYNKIQVIEITQKSIQNAINSLYLNEDWGNPKEYDIKINKSGKELKTEYVVTPSPSKPIKPEILDEYKKLNINLEALFEGKDPFDTKKEIDLEDHPF